MVSLFHRDCLAPSIQHWSLLARVQRDARIQPPSGNFKRPLNQFKIRNPLLVEDRWSSCCVTSLEDCWLPPLRDQTLGCKANLIQPSLMRKSCGWRKGIQIQLIDQFEETWKPWELMERSSKWKKPGNSWILSFSHSILNFSPCVCVYLPSSPKGIPWPCISPMEGWNVNLVFSIPRKHASNLPHALLRFWKSQIDTSKANSPGNAIHQYK